MRELDELEIKLKKLYDSRGWENTRNKELWNIADSVWDQCHQTCWWREHNPLIRTAEAQALAKTYGYFDEYGDNLDLYVNHHNPFPGCTFLSVPVKELFLELDSLQYLDNTFPQTKYYTRLQRLIPPSKKRNWYYHITFMSDEVFIARVEGVTEKSILVTPPEDLDFFDEVETYNKPTLLNGIDKLKGFFKSFISRLK